MFNSLLLVLALILPTQSPGPLFIAGGNISDIKIYSQFVETVGPGKVAIVTTASNQPNFNEANWRQAGLKDYVVIHGDSAFPKNVRAVWFTGGDQGFLEKNYIGKQFETDLLNFWRGGGIVGGSSAGAAIMSRIMIRDSTDDIPEMGTGFDLVPNCIVDQHFSQRNRLPRLKRACANFPGLVGLGIDENTAVVYDKQVMQVIGHNKVTVLHQGKVTEILSGEKFYYPFVRLGRPD